MIDRKMWILILGFVIFSNVCFSQYDFRKGFIITKSNDTITGFIDYANPDISSKYCYFKKDSLSKTTEYSPTDLKAYSFTNSKYFVSKRVNIENDTTFLFLEFLLKGVLNLYYCSESNKEYYFIEKDSKLYPLTNDEVKVYIIGQSKVKRSNNYIGILNWLMGDGADFSKEIYSTKFDHSSLIQLTKDYHSRVCKDKECVVYYKKQKKLNDAKWQINYGFLMEYVLSKINMSINISEGSPGGMYGYPTYKGYVLKNAHSKTDSTNNLNIESQTSSFVPGFFVNFNRNDRVSLQFELKYQVLKYSSIELNSIQFPISVVYDIVRYKKLTPYMKLGVLNAYYLDLKNNNLYYNYDALDESSLEKDPFSTPIYKTHSIYFKRDDFIKNNYKASLAFGCGIRYTLTNRCKFQLEVNNHFTNFKLYYSDNISNACLSNALKFYEMSFLMSYSF